VGFPQINSWVFFIFCYFSAESTSFKALLKLASVFFFQKSLPGFMTDPWLQVPQPATQVSHEYFHGSTHGDSQVTHTHDKH
jgi:hypothetical protein